ncbi:integral membrane protein [Geosmithia morbida]|uniref:Integral membrane protein n=1 Tax=Geosmithia morbida TaxID=1094350 RepID=A0A9P4YRX1_9HYPO|nr:uncharacterized protein GMORB2_3036 [Geosmithia morbida]KAF4120598.1 integral membrane protein [Geosmithia morbida]
MSSSYPGAAPPPAGVTPDLENPTDVLRTIIFVTQALTLVFVTFFSSYAATIFYAPMAMTVKLSLLLIIIRVFGSVHKKTLIGIYVLVGIIVAYYTTGLFIKIFICWPISAYWKGETQKCLDQSAVITADAIISVVSDLAILFLPTPLTWSLQMPLKRRMRIIGMLAGGGVATGFSIYRLILIVDDGKSVNQSIVFAKVILSGPIQSSSAADELQRNAEAGIGLICACLPAANAMLTKIRDPTYFLGNSRSRHDTTGNRGEIVMTRSFHINTSDRDTKDPGNDIYDLGQEEAVLTSSAQQWVMLPKSI